MKEHVERRRGAKLIFELEDVLAPLQRSPVPAPPVSNLMSTRVVARHRKHKRATRQQAKAPQEGFAHGQSAYVYGQHAFKQL